MQSEDVSHVSYSIKQHSALQQKGLLYELSLTLLPGDNPKYMYTFIFFIWVAKSSIKLREDMSMTLGWEPVEHSTVSTIVLRWKQWVETQKTIVQQYSNRYEQFLLSNMHAQRE